MSKRLRLICYLLLTCVAMALGATLNGTYEVTGNLKVDGTCTGCATGSVSISGTPSAGQVPYWTNSTTQAGASITGAVKAGNPPAQAACADLSNAAASCSTDTTVATNISSGTLSASRLPAGSWVLISSQTVSGSAAASVTFSGISGSYTNLKITLTARGDTAATTTGVQAQFNADTGTNYTDDFYFEQNAACCNPGQANAAASFFAGNISAASALANAPGIIVLELPDYSGTTFLKLLSGTWFALNGSTIAGQRQLGATGGYWNNANAITAIKLFPTAGNFAIGSTFQLYAQ